MHTPVSVGTGGTRPEYTQHALWLSRELVFRRMHSNAWMWVHSAAAARVVRAGERAGRALSSNLDGNNSHDDRVRTRFGKVLPDIGAPRYNGMPRCAAHLHARDAQLFDYIGPSLRCVNSELVGHLQQAQL